MNKKSLLLCAAAIGFLGINGLQAEAAIDETVKNIDIDFYYQKDRVRIDFKQDKKGKITKSDIRNDIKGEKFRKELGEQKIREMFKDVDFNTASNNEIFMAILDYIDAPSGSEFTKGTFNSRFWDGKKTFNFSDKEVLQSGEVTNNKDLRKIDATVYYGKEKVDFKYTVLNKSISSSYRNTITGERYKGLQSAAKVNDLLKGFHLRNSANYEVNTYLLSGLEESTGGAEATRIVLRAEFTNGAKRNYDVRL